MKIHYTTLVFITKTSVAINVFIFMYLTMSYIPPAPTYAKLGLFQQSARLFNVQNGDYETDRHEKRQRTTTVEICHKSIVLFGIRKFWFRFCSYDEFSQYKYLTQFPRKFFCPEVNCWVTVNHTRTPSLIRHYDVVLFTEVDEWMTHEMWEYVHGNRNKGQRWVMVTEESPLYTPGLRPPDKYTSVTFDWVGSYNSKSDFVQPYGYYRPFPDGHPSVKLDREKISNKSGIAVWLGSHCETLQWDRLKFVNDLAMFLTLDKFGKCGGREIIWNRDDVLRDVLSPYRFYLSLENSCCSEYITEKLWRTLQMGLIPIVVGPPIEDYEKLAPPNSFIHPDQFDSIVAMATHILDVASNEEKFLSYFQWRTRGEIVVYTQEEYYVHPLTNSSNCGIIKKYLNTPPSDESKTDYLGSRWAGGCTDCSKKKWFNIKYMHPKNHTHRGV